MGSDFTYVFFDTELKSEYYEWNKSKNVIGRNLKLFEKGKLYHLRLGGDKKNFYGTKLELQKIYDKRKKAGGLQVDVTSKKYKDAIPEGYGTNQDLINKMKSKGIYVSDSSYAPSLAKNFNIKTKAHSLVANHNVYDLTKLHDPKFVLKINKKHHKSVLIYDYLKIYQK